MSNSHPVSLYHNIANITPGLLRVAVIYIANRACRDRLVFQRINIIPTKNLRVLEVAIIQVRMNSMSLNTILRRFLVNTRRIILGLSIVIRSVGVQRATTELSIIQTLIGRARREIITGMDIMAMIMTIATGVV
jgi:hypothetical protein